MDSESEGALKNNNSNSAIKRRRIVETYLLSDDDDGVPCAFSTNCLKVNELPKRNGLIPFSSFAITTFSGFQETH